MSDAPTSTALGREDRSASDADVLGRWGRLAILRSRPWWWVVAAWLISRLLYGVAGVGFDTRPLDASIQLLDRELLGGPFWQSVWHLHQQPPLFNFFVGSWLHLPVDPEVSFGIAFRAFGLLLAILQYALLVDLRVGRKVAAVVVAGFTISPAAVLYESYLSYALPVALLLVATAFALLRYLRSGATWAAVTAASSMAALALVRSTYHLVVAVALGAVLLLAGRRLGLRKAAVVGVVLPVAVVAALYTRNAVRWGELTSSTWFGMNLARVAFPSDPATLSPLVEEGELSRQALIKPFTWLNDYPPKAVDPTGVPALDDEFTSAGIPNYNNIRYVEISRQYRRDALTLIRLRPGEYVRSVGKSLRFALLPAGDYPFLDVNREHIVDLDRAVSKVLGLQWRRYEDRVAVLNPKEGAPEWSQVSWTVVAGYGVAVFGPVVLWVARRRGRHRDQGPRFDGAAVLMLVVMSAVVTYAFLAGIAFEIGENNRFRFETDPLVFVMAVALVAAAVARVRGAEAR